MRAQASANWNRDRTAVAVAIPFSAGFGGISMREILATVCDTLVVLGMQIVFRVTTILRHLNY